MTSALHIVIGHQLLLINSLFQTRVCKEDVTEGGKREINNSGSDGERLPRVPSFPVCVGEKFIIKKKKRDRGPALKETDDEHGQLGHLQRELLPVLWC